MNRWAAGANYQDQMATERTNALTNLMLNEENALILSVATGTDLNGRLSTDTPWGDGVNALGFKGLWAAINAADGTPVAQIQALVGPLTLSHIDAQLRRLYNQGALQQWMLLNGQEIMSLTHLAEASGSIIRVSATAQADTLLGVFVTGYKHPLTGDIVQVMPSRFLTAGNMIFGSDMLPDGSPSADVSVLPQVSLPELAPNEQIMGYTAQEIAPSISAPHVFPFIASVYETLRVKSAAHFAKSSGVTAV